jgi:hypothetical protein
MCKTTPKLGKRRICFPAIINGAFPCLAYNNSRMNNANAPPQNSVGTYTLAKINAVV